MKKGDRSSDKGDLPSQIEIREIAHPRREISLLKKERSPFCHQKRDFPVCDRKEISVFRERVISIL
jgi:hypothetical protein